jgi:Co/Zn/Cd efflux system component
VAEQGELTYERVDGELHRHGGLAHAHPHVGAHTHDLPAHGVSHHRHDHGHSHGLVHDSIKRSSEGVRAVLMSLAVLGATAVAQTLIFVASGSVALLADLIHNFGDALTAVPLGTAFMLRSERAERGAGLFVVAAIFISACVAGAEAVQRLIDQQPPDHLWALAGAGLLGYLGNFVAAEVRTRAGRRLNSTALIADGDHARADAYVSLGVVASAAVVAIGVPIADPLVGLAITVVILRITWQSWATVRGPGPAIDGRRGHARGSGAKRLAKRS